MFKNLRVRSVAACAFSFAYLLSFLFEGQVLYGLLGQFHIPMNAYLLSGILSHLIGLFTCGFFVHTPKAAKGALCGGLLTSFLATIPFFFRPTALWLVAIPLASYTSGCALAAWGYVLKSLVSKHLRLKTCADVLIYSNLLMIAINVIASRMSSFWGLVAGMFSLAIGIVFCFTLPDHSEGIRSEEIKRGGVDRIRSPLLLLCFFVFFITINSGLMYQVINPAFAHLTGLTSWYWAVPYIVALTLVRNLPLKANRSLLLYAGMAMMMISFISFMKLGRNSFDYLIVDTLMLGACGIFDLFWWSILGEMLDYTKHPARVFGIGLSANVAGVLCGEMVGMAVTSMRIPGAEVTVIALTVVCITLVMLPPLNRQLLLLLKSHAYLIAFDRMTDVQQNMALNRIQTFDPLTSREKEVLQCILSGKPNRDIAGELCITENTVKTHVRNIFSKYEVQSRAELISLLLKNQSGTGV